jgi:hypothetical protein
MPEELTPKARVAKAFAHEEPDRVPTFELAFSTKLAREVLGDEAFFPRSGGLSLKKILLANMEGRDARRALIAAGTRTQVELFMALGYDATYLIPTEFLQPVCGSFGLFGSNYLFDVEIRETAPDTWEVRQGDMWSVYRYSADSDTFCSVSDFLSTGGIPALRRYVEALEANDPGLNDYTRDALESTRLAVEMSRGGGLFIFGHGDICHPNDQAYLPLFLEAVALEPELVDRFFAVTTAGMLPLVEAQIELGVDGILGATDWCFKSGPIMSPAMVRRFLVPHLKTIAELAHRHGLPFVQHLDGNTMQVLPMLLEEVGIDGYHAIEPTAGMDIGSLKRRYGRDLTLLGNLDCGDLLTNASPAQVAAATRRLIAEVAPGGGFVLASSNAIHDGIPRANLQAMLETARSYGTYPIRALEES